MSTKITETTDSIAEPEAACLEGVRVLVLFGGDRMFGSEIGNLEVFRQMAKLGLKARFITRKSCGHREIEPELDRLGFEWATAPFGFHWGRYLFGRYFYYLGFNVYGVIVTSWRVWREARRWKATHLYCMNWIFFTYTMPAILWLRLPLIYRVGDEFPMHTRFHRWVAGKLVRRVDRMVCISNFIRQCMVRVGVAEKKIKVIYNYPTERAGRLPLSELPVVRAGALVLVYVGRVSAAKGVVVLIEAVERLIRQGKNLVLWIVGSSGFSDNTYDELRNQVELKSTEQRISFLGHVDDVYSFYSRADIHVCPSLVTEALSHVVLEAKLCGKPSVVFPTGGLPELIEHCVDGYVCKEATVEALIEGIEFFASNAERRKTAGALARRSLDEKFSLVNYRHRWAEVFDSTASAG